MSCNCEGPGFCDRHGVKKSQRHWELCQFNQAYWEAWEAGYGPGQKAKGLGDTVAKTILTATKGKVKQCGGCKKRKEYLNRLVPYPVKWTPVDDYLAPRRELAVITIAIGDQYEEMSKITFPKLEEYADKVGADFVPLMGKTQEWWGLEKFRVKEVSKRYRRCVFIDADAYVKSDCENLFELVPEGTVGIHNDWPYLSKRAWMSSEWKKMHEAQGRDSRIDKGFCLNSGVVVFDNPDIWGVPEKRFIPTHTAEQVWVHSNIRELKLEVSDLPLKFNSQHWMKDFSGLIPTASIVHMANANHSERMDILNRLKQQGA